MKTMKSLLFIFTFLSHHVIANAETETKSQPIENGVNFVKVSDRIDTSGQPSLGLLESFSEKNYGLVINLAPPLSKGSIMQEGGLIAKNGTKYVNIPVDWQHPTWQDFDFFSQVLNISGNKKILVHCQINMRGSLFTFLYRVIHEKIDPVIAQEKMTAVWVPTDQWLTFAQAMLDKHHIEFTLF